MRKHEPALKLSVICEACSKAPIVTSAMICLICGKTFGLKSSMVKLRFFVFLIFTHMNGLTFFSCCLLFFSCLSDPPDEKRYVDLSSKGLRSVPDSVLEIKNLVFLDLGNDGFTMYPPLSALGENSLGPDANMIESLPEEFTELTELRSLYLHTNELKGLPKGFHRLAALDTLDLSFNFKLRLSDILTELKKMTGLKYLSVLGISVDINSIEELRESLPTTKILATIHDVEAVDSVEIEQ